jgi:asparagine synthase (glutamine-hydrolysing)
MCGIAGFVGAGGREDIERMTTALTHRGPDGEGFFDGTPHGLHLGFRRLAVRDLAGGNQPMWNENHRVCVCTTARSGNPRSALAYGRLSASMTAFAMR